MKTKVSIIPCSEYNQAEVDVAVKFSIDALGGIEKFVQKGTKVLIKPNLLLEKKPEECVTTHPAVIKAIIKLVKKAGGVVFVGDSPGAAIQGTERILEVSGVKEAVLDEGGEIVNFETCGVKKISTNFPFITHYYISSIIDKIDVIINVPKLKTHGLTKYTGAIKNMFGIVPGMHKPEIHRNAPKIKDFCSVLVHVFSNAKPVLNIMDAIYGMEGNGPSSGSPRKIGYIISSEDAVALDSVASYLIGYNSQDILTTTIAYQHQIGEMNLNNIDIQGLDLDSIRMQNFIKPAVSLSQKMPLFLLKYAYSQIKIKPFVNDEKCKHCLICVKHCPMLAIKFSDNKFNFDYSLCIECFCCHELCKYKAIELDMSWLAKLILKDRNKK